MQWVLVVERPRKWWSWSLRWPGRQKQGSLEVWKDGADAAETRTRSAVATYRVGTFTTRLSEGARPIQRPNNKHRTHSSDTGSAMAML